MHFNFLSSASLHYSVRVAAALLALSCTAFHSSSMVSFYGSVRLTRAAPPLQPAVKVRVVNEVSLSAVVAEEGVRVERLGTMWH